jgi:PAS domain S-box-containing protein
MTKQKQLSQGAAAPSASSRQELRRRAEEIARGKAAPSPEDLDAHSHKETRQMLHELLVHQIELEMQNEELRRTQAELDAARARFFNLYDLAPVGYCTVSEEGLILEANLTAATLLGVAKGALVKQPLTRFILPGDQDIYYLHRKQLFETGAPQVCELRLVKKDGSQFWARFEAAAVQDGENGNTVCRTVVSDITKRKRAEEALQQAHAELEQRVAERTEALRQANEELRTEITERKQAEEARRESDANFRNMTEQLVDVLFAIDDSGFITFVSPSALQVFGWKPDEMVGRNFIELLPDPEIPGAVKKIKEVMASGQSIQNLSIIMKRKDESNFSGELNSSAIWKDGRIAGAIGLIRDITERRRVEEALKESEERYRNQVESISDVAYAVGSGGEITYISPVVRNLLGYEPDEITGRHFLEFVHKDDHDLLKRKFAELREGIVSPDEYRLIGKYGDIKCVRTLTRPINEVDGFAGGRGIIIDFTERKSLEMQLMQAQKMDALGTLASGIAHDFNNILSSLIGFTEMAMDESDDEQRRHHLDQVLVSCDRAKNLISQIITFSRKSGVEKKPLFIGALVREFVELLRAITPATIEVRQRIASEDLFAAANPTQMHQVMMNLCANAIHAMTGKVGVLEITLSAMNFAFDSPLLSLDIKPGSYVKLEVRDTGHGIDPADISRIFDPFFTTKGGAKGSGLGLSVVYGIVKNHGGAVAVDSVPGAGSTFTVYIPALQSHEEREEAEVGEMPHGHERILFVDDEKSIVEIGRGMLKKLGYVVLDFTDCVQACEAFKRSPYAYDLVITDMTMPRMTGVELSREVLKVRPEMPIIICTGHSDLIDEDKAKQEGIRRFVMKPLRRKEIANAVRSVLDEEKGE